MRFKSKKSVAELREMTLPEALVYFDGKVSGVWPQLTQDELNNVLEGYRSAMTGHRGFADEIKQYLIGHGVSPLDIRPARYETFESSQLMRRIRQPHAKVRPWLWDWAVRVVRIIRRMK